MLLLLLGLLFCCLIELHCDDSHEISSPYLYFKGQNLSNNSYVDITEIGRTGNGSDSIQCRSELQNCCQTAGNLTGSWSYPDGSEVGGPDDITQSRGTMRADLRRRNDANSPVGIYCCRIAYNSSDPSAKETLCVGIYGSSSGKVKISGDMTLTVNSDLNGGSPQFTLTCISTGGPATTVTWTRDSTTVTEGNMTVLDDTETAQYNHTLTVTGRKPGPYICAVENNISSNSTTYYLQVAFPPTNLTYEIRSNFTSILLMWVPPSPLGDTTGYRISYNAVGGSRNIVNDINTSNYTLSGLKKEKEYNISIIGISAHFFSLSVAWTPITLPGGREDIGEEKEQKVNESIGTDTPASTSLPEVGLEIVIAVSAVFLLLVVTLTMLNITQCLVIIRMRRSSRDKTKIYAEITTNTTDSAKEICPLQKITTDEAIYEVMK